MTDSYDYESIAKMIDHSLLNPALTTRELEEGCALAARYNVASVCILPYYLARCAELLAGTTVQASGGPRVGQCGSRRLWDRKGDGAGVGYVRAAGRDGAGGRKGRCNLARGTIHAFGRNKRKTPHCLERRVVEA